MGSENTIKFFPYAARPAGPANIIKSSDNDFSADMSFWTAELGNSGSNNAIERMTILTNGNVGINNNAPTYKLDTTGDIRATN